MWYGEPNAIGHAKFYSRSHDAVIHVYDGAGNVIETHERTGVQRVVGSIIWCQTTLLPPGDGTGQSNRLRETTARSSHYPESCRSGKVRSSRKRDTLRLERVRKKVERIAGLQDLLATWEQAGDVEEARRVNEKLQIARKQLEVMRP